MTTPRFTNCSSHRSFVDMWRMIPTPSRLHMHCPARVRFEIPVPWTTRLHESTVSHWWPTLLSFATLVRSSAFATCGCNIKSVHVHFVLVCGFPALLAWACADVQNCVTWSHTSLPERGAHPSAQRFYSSTHVSD